MNDMTVERRKLIAAASDYRMGFINAGFAVDCGGLVELHKGLLDAVEYYEALPENNMTEEEMLE